MTENQVFLLADFRTDMSVELQIRVQGIRSRRITFVEAVGHDAYPKTNSLLAGFVFIDWRGRSSPNVVPHA